MANNPIDDDSDSSQRQLFIRRYIEDRLEQKRLEELSDEKYWDSLES